MLTLPSATPSNRPIAPLSGTSRVPSRMEIIHRSSFAWQLSVLSPVTTAAVSRVPVMGAALSPRTARAIPSATCAVSNSWGR